MVEYMCSTREVLGSVASTFIKKKIKVSREAQEPQNILVSASHTILGTVQKPTRIEDNGENICPFLADEALVPNPEWISSCGQLCCLPEVLLAGLRRLM